MKLRLKIEKPEHLFFIVFLVVIANFLLALVLAYPLIMKGTQIPQPITSIVIIINFFIFYMLLLSFLNYYTGVIATLIKKYKWTTVLILLGVGLIGMVVLSFITLGRQNTLNWLIPALATIILIILSRVYDKYKSEWNKKRKDEKKRVKALTDY